jgi:hypothetical protein
MKRLLLLALLLTGCGEETKAVTATPTRTATPTPTVKPAPPAERATAELRNYLGKNTQDMRGRCVPADELFMDAIAAVDCDFREGPRGGYLLFDSKSDLEDYFGLVTAASKRIRGTKCSGDTWGRKAHETLGWLGLYRRHARTLLIWTDNDALVVGTIRTRTASSKTLCGLWRESG